MKIIILCSLLMSATAYHGTLYSEYTTVEFVPNVEQIDQTPIGGNQKSENDIGINLYTTTISPVFTSSQDELGQKEQTSDIDDETLELIFGPSTVKGVESSTTQFSETDLINAIGTKSTLHNLIETSGIGRIDVRSTKNMPEVQNVQRGQYAQGSKPGSQRRDYTKKQFGTSSHGFEDNSNIGYNSVGFSSTPNLITSGGKTDEVSTQSSIGETKGSQPRASSDYPTLRPKNQVGQPNVTPTYPIFRPVKQDESTQPSLYPTFPNTKPGNQGGSNQPGVIPTYTITRPGNEGGSNQPGVNPTHSTTRPGNKGGSTQIGVSPTYQITRPANQGGSNQPGVIPTYTFNRPGNQGGSSYPGVNPMHSNTRPGNKGSSSSSTPTRVSPTYPMFQSGNQGSVYWPGIQIGVNPTAVPVGQGGVPSIIPGYWPYVQYGQYYSPHYTPGYGGYGYQDWFGNGQNYFYSYPSHGAQYVWPYTQDTVGYGNGWLGFNGQERRTYNHNHGSLNGPEHQYSHHHHHQQPEGQHSYHFHYNHNRGY